MKYLLKLATAIDASNERIGRITIWLVLIAALVSAGNAAARKALHLGSNGLLELQWYLFAASFMLAAAFTLLHNEHVRIDVVSGRFSKRVQTWIDLFGFTVFLLPLCGALLYMSVPFFLQAYRSGETSVSAGGLVLWPVYLMMPLGFALLLLQCFSEIIKRAGFLKGVSTDPTVKKADEKSSEQELADLIRRQLQAKR